MTVTDHSLNPAGAGVWFSRSVAAGQGLVARRRGSPTSQCVKKVLHFNILLRSSSIGYSVDKLETVFLKLTAKVTITLLLSNNDNGDFHYN